MATSRPTFQASNSFHDTVVNLYFPPGGILSKRQVTRARKALCGISTCTCGGSLGERGKQPRLRGMPADMGWICEPLDDGRVQLFGTNSR